MSILHEAGIKTARRNINSLRHTDIILMAESEEKLKLPLMRVKEESEKAGLKFNIKKLIITVKPMAFWSHYFMAHRRGKSRSDRFYLVGLQNHSRW